MKTTFFDAWQFLQQHRIFNTQRLLDKSRIPIIFPGETAITSVRHSHFEAGFSVQVVQVCPKTQRIDIENPENNTLTQCWFEVAVPYDDEDDERGFVLATEDSLSLSSDTFEQGVVALAAKVRILFGDDRRGVAMCLSN
jgi:hypothetical protein